MNQLWCFSIALMAASALAVPAALVDRVPADALEFRNPFAGNDTARRAGAKLYARECSSCHGPAREGWRKVPSLSQSEVAAAPPGKLFWILRNGSLARGMPSFAHLPEPQRWQIVTFLTAKPQ